MKVIVTGGAGYIGSVVVEELIREGAHVRVVDNFATGHLAAVHPDAAFLRATVDYGEADRAVRETRPDAVMHFASYTLVSESMKHPQRYLLYSYQAGVDLIRASIERGVRRIIFSSTANLYGSPKRIPITEDEEIDPGSPYGESKYMVERALRWYERLYGCRYASLRYFNACGATDECGEDHRPETHLIPLVLQVALGKRDRVTIYGDDYDTPDGTCVRDYIHVQDLARAHILALRALEDGRSRVYNLGIGRGYSVREVIETAREVTGHPIPVEIGPRRPGDPPVLVASNERIRAELGWEPQYTDLRSMIESAWRWHQAHPDGYPPNPSIFDNPHESPARRRRAR